MLSDIERGIINIKNYIESYPGRFRDALAPSSANTSTAIAGYRHERTQLYYFTEEGFREACGGHNHKVIAKVLRDRQLLDTNDSGRLKKKVRIAGLTTRPYVYAVREAILEVGNEQPPIASGSEANGANEALLNVLQVPPPQLGDGLQRAPF